MIFYFSNKNENIIQTYGLTSLLYQQLHQRSLIDSTSNVDLYNVITN